MDIGSTFQMWVKMKEIFKKIDDCAYIWLPTLLLIIVFYPASLLAILITIVIVCSRLISMSHRQRNDQNEYKNCT